MKIIKKVNNQNYIKLEILEYDTILTINLDLKYNKKRYKTSFYYALTRDEIENDVIRWNSDRINSILKIIRKEIFCNDEVNEKIREVLNLIKFKDFDRNKSIDNKFINIYNMSDEEIETLIGHYFKKMLLDQIINNLEKAGIFKEFNRDEIIQNIIKTKRKEG